MLWWGGRSKQQELGGHTAARSSHNCDAVCTGVATTGHAAVAAAKAGKEASEDEDEGIDRDDKDVANEEEEELVVAQAHTVVHLTKIDWNTTRCVVEVTPQLVVAVVVVHAEISTLTQGQWWSIFTMQRWQREQWWARLGLKASHLARMTTHDRL